MFVMSIFTVVVWTVWLYFRLAKGGTCPRPVPDQNFKIEGYYGRWFEFARDENYYQDKPCVSSDYFAVDNNMVSVNHREWSIGSTTNKGWNQYRDSFRAHCSSFVPGKCEVRPSPVVPFQSYNIMATDPNEYALIYSCTVWFGGAYRNEDFWIQTR